MTHPLLPCPACERHVRSIETECPFCRARLALRAPPRAPLREARLGSLAVMTFRVIALGAALAACGSADEDGDDQGTAGKPAAGGGGKGGSASHPDDTAGSSGGGRGGLSVGGATFGGSPSDGGQVPVYRATPKG